MSMKSWIERALGRLPGYRQEHPLAHRRTMYVLVCSLGFALLSTALQLGIEYRREMRLIEQRLELIRSGADTFNVLVVRRDINELAAPHETATTEAWRVVDRRIQALRKAGEIAFRRDAQRWEVV